MEPKDLGALIFEWKTTKTMAIATVIVGALLLAGSVATHEPIAIAAAVVLFLGFVAAAASTFINTLRCYQRGLVKKTLFGEKQVTYSAVDVLSYQATRVVGIYAQTNVRVDVVPAKPHPRISLFGPYRDGVEAFRDAVAAAVARKMLDRLATEPEITWTGKVVLSRQGVRFEKPKFIGSETVFIPFAENPKMSFDAGTFFLAGREMTLTMNVGSPNFFPGYQAMRVLLASAQP